MMKFKNYKDLLNNISKDKDVQLTISLWTYQSKRMVFKVGFEQVKNCLDGDMLFGYDKRKLNFTSQDGQKRSFQLDQLRISKVDYVEINDKSTFQ